MFLVELPISKKKDKVLRKFIDTRKNFTMKITYLFFVSSLFLTFCTAQEYTSKFEKVPKCTIYDFFVGGCHPCDLSACPPPRVKFNINCKLYVCTESTTTTATTTTTTLTTTTTTATTTTTKRTTSTPKRIIRDQTTKAPTTTTTTTTTRATTSEITTMTTEPTSHFGM